MNKTKRIYLSIFLSFLLYVIYLQLSVGNIWWRNNIFQPMQILEYFKNPLYHGWLWNIQMLDINPYFFIPIISIMIYFLSKHIV